MVVLISAINISGGGWWEWDSGVLSSVLWPFEPHVGVDFLAGKQIYLNMIRAMRGPYCVWWLICGFTLVGALWEMKTQFNTAGPHLQPGSVPPPHRHRCAALVPAREAGGHWH